MKITPEMLEHGADALKNLSVVTPHNNEAHPLGDDFNWLSLVRFASAVLEAAFESLEPKSERG